MPDRQKETRPDGKSLSPTAETAPENLNKIIVHEPRLTFEKRKTTRQNAEEVQAHPPLKTISEDRRIKPRDLTTNALLLKIKKSHR